MACPGSMLCQSHTSQLAVCQRWQVSTPCALRAAEAPPAQPSSMLRCRICMPGHASTAQPTLSSISEPSSARTKQARVWSGSSTQPGGLLPTKPGCFSGSATPRIRSSLCQPMSVMSNRKQVMALNKSCSRAQTQLHSLSETRFRRPPVRRAPHRDWEIQWVCA